MRSSKGMLILHLTITPWEVGQVMSRQSLAYALSFHCVNIYHAIFRANFADIFADPNKNFLQRSKLEKIKDNLYVTRMSSWLGTIYRYHFMAQIQRRREARKLIKWINKIKNGDTIVVLYCWNPECKPYIDLIPHDFLVYHIYDDYHSFDQSVNLGSIIQEQWLINNADMLCVVTEELASKKNITRPWQHCPAGVNCDIFYPRYELPFSYKSLKKGGNLIGYFGMINEKIDFALLYELVRSCKQYRFLFAGLIGRMSNENQRLWKMIASCENVLHLGCLPQHEVAFLCNLVDVGFMPYVVNKTWAQYGFPLKLFEFLACGTPVVSTPLPSLAPYHGYIYLAKDALQMEEQIHLAIAEDNPQKRKQRVNLARENSWKNRAISILDAIRKQVGSK